MGRAGIRRPTRESRRIPGGRADLGLFRAPTLRDLVVTAPYMHDGSVETLEHVLDHYAAGSRTIESGPFRGIGRQHPNKSRFVNGFEATPTERDDLIAFLEALTDSTFLADPGFADPWLRGVGQE